MSFAADSKHGMYAELCQLRPMVMNTQMCMYKNQFEKGQVVDVVQLIHEYERHLLLGEL